MTRKILTRDFVLCFFAQLTFIFVYFSLIPILPIYLSKFRSTEPEIGVLIGIFFLSSLISRPFTGRALTKIPEKTIMSIGGLLFALTSVAYLLAPPFWPLLIVRLFQGIGFGCFHTASFTLVANISSKNQRGQSLNYLYLAHNLSGALGPSLGMFLANHFSFNFFFLVCLGLSFCLLFVTKRLGRRQVTALQDSAVEPSFFLSREALPPSIVNSLSLFIWGAFTAFFPLYAINHGVANPGLFFTTVAIVLILGRGLGGKILDLYSKERIILPCLFTYIISMIRANLKED